jgi:hypothetical protein
MLSIITTKTREVQSRRPRGPLVVNLASPQMNGLVAWYPAHPFTLATGNGWNNALNTRYPMTNGGGATVKYDQLMGRSFLFDDAATQYFTIGSAILTAAPLTLAAWVMSDDSASSIAAIDLHNPASLNFRNGFMLVLDNTTDGQGVTAVTSSSTATSAAQTTTDYVVGKWEHACAVFASATDRRAFLNASGKTTETTSRVPSGISNASIGRISSSSPIYYCSGAISDARIYNRALSDFDVYQLYDYKTRWELYYPIGRVSYFFANPVNAALTGTITASATEADIVAGGKTIVITLTGDTWIAAGAGSFDLQRDEILQGLDSAQSEALGWNNIVRDLEAVTAVVRTSNTVVTITLSAAPLYNITAQETITVTVPGTALTGGVDITASPAFTVDTMAGRTTKNTRSAPLGVNVGMGWRMAA